MPNIWAGGPPDRRISPDVPSLGLIHEGPTFTRFTNTPVGATAPLTSITVKGSPARGSTKGGWQNNRPSDHALNIVFVEKFF